MPSGITRKEEGRRNGNAGGECQHSNIDRELSPGGDRVGHGRGHSADDEPRGHEGDQTAGDGEDRSLREQQLHQASAACAERGSHCDFTRARCGPAEHERRDVGARHEEHEANSPQEQQHRPFHPADDLVPKGRSGQADREARVLQRGGVVGIDPSCQYIELRSGFVDRHAALQPGNHAVIELAATFLSLSVGERHRHPDAGRLVVRLGTAAGELEASGHDADHRVRPAVERDGLTHDRAVASVTRLPEPPAQHRHVHTGPVLLRAEIAAQQRADAEQREQARRDLGAIDPDRLGASRELKRKVHVRRHVLERLLVALDIEKVRRREGDVFHAEALMQGHETLGVREPERPDERRVDDAEGRRD